MAEFKEVKKVYLSLDNIEEIARATGETKEWLRRQYFEAKAKGMVVEVRF